MPDPGEQTAIEQLKQGDINGLEFLVRMYQLKAVKAAYLVTRDRTSAEDVVQAAFIKAYQRIQQFDSKRPFEPWFTRIVVNDAIKAARRSRRDISLERSEYNTEAALADILRSAEPGPEELVDRAEVASAIEDALDRLSPDQRAAVVLRYYLGLKEPEIALRIGKARGTVKWLLHKARRRLSDLLTTSDEFAATKPERAKESLNGDRQ